MSKLSQVFQLFIIELQQNSINKWNCSQWAKENSTELQSINKSIFGKLS